jgi:hypothetical protein
MAVAVVQTLKAQPPVRVVLEVVQRVPHVQQPEALVIRPLHHRRRVTREEVAALVALTMVPLVAVALTQLDQTEQQPQAATAATAQRLAFLAAALLMLVAAVAELMLVELSAMAALAVVVTLALLAVVMHRQELSTPEAVVAVGQQILRLPCAAQAAQVALASSYSSTPYPYSLS